MSEHYVNKENQLEKINEFRNAIEKYNNNALYNKFCLLVSVLIISLQFITCYQLIFVNNASSYSVIFSIISFIIAYIITDFINGLAHMYMDNNVHYKSCVGPFIAAFHMHHKQQLYQYRSPLKVYFYESGTKFWLLIYLLGVLYLQHAQSIPFALNLFLVAVGILSSFAEVSHYWCHNVKSNQALILKMQKAGILLSMDHHKIHHTQDNINYAFLNGMSDKLINIMASKLFEGYKNHSDIHAKSYSGQQTSNRICN